ncbi:hypothetical protein F2Q69_00049139 [Brassica cretica]|uniref:Reverse transcriptase zinc-binding domain-containing protein n=1 Tax=Brassica cretica TaxID=69181 RepID=A0A8S9PUF7_BRACR|nr:hypothetical protein F2Q69_00049139 [Brassica cretica]
MAALGPVSIDEKDLMVSDVMTRETGMWNKEALLKHLPELMEDILHLQPSITGAEDGYAWLLTPSGDYTSKSGYLALQLENAAPPQRTQNIPDDFNWFKSLWNTETLPKIQLFLWKVLQNAIPSELQSSRQRINLPPLGVTINLFPWIFTDSAKKELHRGSTFINHISSPLLAESLAITALLLHASTLGFTNIWITELFGVLSDIASLSLFLSHLVSFPEQTMGRPTGLPNLLFRMGLVGS